MKHCDSTHLVTRLGSLATELGLSLTEQDLEALVDHLCWVLRTNLSINLTAITEPDNAVRLHVLDSLVALPEVEGSPPGPMCDVGSGAGFPGVPLGVVTGRETVLVDSVGKKMRVLQEYLDERGHSPRIHTQAGRAEELSSGLSGRFAVVTMRAVSRLPSLVELAAPLLLRGGRLVALKGPVERDELDAGAVAAKLCGLEMVQARRTTLPESHESRTIVTYVARSAPRLKLPRRTGLAQSKPLA